MRASIRDLLLTRIGKLVTTLVIVLAVLALVIHLGSAKNLKLPQYVQLVLDGLRGGAI